MSYISDELRRFSDSIDGYAKAKVDRFDDDLGCISYLNSGGITKGAFTTKWFRNIADRIDAEMVELPKDRDGAPIHLGDTVYLEDGREAKVYSIELTNGKDAIRESITVNIQGLMHCTLVNIPSSLTHTNPDSWERIADELEAWCDDSDVDGDACDVPRAIAGRIRTLAKREGEQCQ